MKITNSSIQTKNKTLTMTEMYRTLDNAKNRQEAQESLSKFLPETIIGDLYEYHKLHQHLSDVIDMADIEARKSEINSDETRGAYCRGFVKSLKWIENNLGKIKTADLPRELTNILSEV